MLRAFSSLDALLERPRRHAVTCRDVGGARAAIRRSVAGQRNEAFFRLAAGACAAGRRQVEAAIESCPPPGAMPRRRPFRSRRPGQAPRQRSPQERERLVTYAIPPTACGQEPDTIAVTAVGKDTARVRRVE